MTPKGPMLPVSKFQTPSLDISRVQETGSTLKISFALSNCPHLHRAYLLASRLNRTPLHTVTAVFRVWD